MKILLKMTAVALVVMFGTTAWADFVPGAPDGLDPFQLHLYENADGMGISHYTLVENVVSGFVVLLDPGQDPYGADRWDPAVWCDVLEFTSDTHRDVYLYSDGYANWDTMVMQVQADGGAGDPYSTAVFFLTSTGNPTLWQPGAAYPYGNEYYIHCNCVVIPAPAAVLLSAFGLGIVGSIKRRFT